MRIEVRPDEDGIDEVLLFDGDVCLFHLERLDDDRYWFALYPPGADDAHFDIVRRRKRLEVIER